MIRRDPLPTSRAALVRALAAVLVADVRENPTRAAATGVSPGGTARTVVGTLHAVASSS